MKNTLNNILKKPVIQFMAIGTLMFLVNTYLIEADSANGDNLDVHLTAGEVKAMEEVWTSKWNRPPTPIELKGMINQSVEESILFREAKKTGIDKGDAIVRQRLSQKLEFLSNDLVKPDSATSQEVESYFKTNITKYTAPEKITVYQLFISPQSYVKSSLEEEVKKRLGKLNNLELASRAVDNYGDQFTLQSYFPDKSAIELSQLFGTEFTNELFQGAINQWYGPLASQYGNHLVYVSNKIPEKEPKLDVIYELVAEDLQREQQNAINKLYIDGILARYNVIVEEVPEEM